MDRTSSSMRRAAPPLLPTPPVPLRAGGVPTDNQRKRERRRRNRQVLYKELEDLVLRHTQVRLQPDGGVVQENDRIRFRISPDLERHDRYNYLLSRLALKPRKSSTSGIERGGTEVPFTSLAPRSGEREKVATTPPPSEDQKAAAAATTTPMEGIEVADRKSVV